MLAPLLESLLLWYALVFATAVRYTPPSDAPLCPKIRLSDILHLAALAVA